MTMQRESLFLCFLLFSSPSFFKLTFADSVADKCNNEFTKVYTCLDFSTGKAKSPSGSCCKSVKEIRDTEAVCLCYIIQQTYKGAPGLKSLGLQIPKLLQLPNDCQLVNASSADCPKLLNLTPSSPEYAIFTNSSAANSSPPATTNSSTPAASGVLTPVEGSGGVVHGPHYDISVILAVGVAVIYSYISVWA